MSGRLIAAFLALLVSTSASAAPAAAPAPVTRSARPSSVPPRATTRPAPVTGYRPPVSGPLVVLRRFDQPLTAYGPGHRGVDLRADSTVVAAGAGVVDFAGSVAGRGVVVIAHPDGIRTEYEPVRPSVHAGQAVRAGDPVGVVTGHHRGCPGSCLHWGARRGQDYLDPLGLLRPLGPVRLLPWGRAGP